ncbi:MAG TPA: hypothetical protein VJY35_08950 [Candidatus Eisenbacteria bacterium]|nr:hypothetical protein [Candidatus Eisenbacteria bacterium]
MTAKHWAGCWREHCCAIARVEMLERDLVEATEREAELLEARTHIAALRGRMKETVARFRQIAAETKRLEAKGLEAELATTFWKALEEIADSIEQGLAQTEVAS